MKRKPIGYIVAYFDPSDGLQAIYGNDPDEPLVIEARDYFPVLFSTPASARDAIRISTAKAKFDESRGEPVNTDFTCKRKNVQIVPVYAANVRGEK